MRSVFVCACKVHRAHLLHACSSAVSALHWNLMQAVCSLKEIDHFQILLQKKIDQFLNSFIEEMLSKSWMSKIRKSRKLSVFDQNLSRKAFDLCTMVGILWNIFDFLSWRKILTKLLYLE